MALFNRSTKQVVRVQPTIPSKMALENGAMGLLEQIRRDHEGNIRICSDLIALRDDADRTKAKVLKEAMENADKLDFFSIALTNMIACLQSETPQQEQEPVLSNAVLIDRSGENGQAPVIGFLSPGARPCR